jgi:DMSO/TMAO reductase YedYZ molybdopterin-dependent catalytic subunit
VPNARFYRIDTALRVPQVDPSSWSLRVHGEVERPFALSYDELLGLPQVEADITIACVSNEVGGSLVGNARWQGVPLRALLERAGVRPAERSCSAARSTASPPASRPRPR